MCESLLQSQRVTQVVVFARQEHLNAVRGHLKEGEYPEDALSLLAFPPRVTRAGSLNKLGLYIWLYLRISNLTPELLLLLNTSRSELEILTLLSNFRRKAHTIAIVHELRYLLRRPSWGHISAKIAPCWYIALSEALAVNIKRRVPATKNNLRFINFPSLTPKHRPQTIVSAKLKFGTLGGFWRRGLEQISDLAKHIHRVAPSAEFHIVGSLRAEQKLPEDWPVWVAGPSETPISPPDYFRLGRNLDWVIWLGTSNQYDFAASGALVDAIMLGKPVIALETELTLGYFREFGPLGILCKDFEELLDKTAQLAEEGLPQSQSDAIALSLEKAQNSFSPNTVGCQFDELLERL